VIAMTATYLAFDDQRLPELMQWFPDASSCALWGGPQFRWPFTPLSFRADARIGELPSRMLIEDVGHAMVAFGQFYQRLGRCHLGRLAVRPDVRGRGAGTRLIRELCAEGCRALEVAEFSLFVLVRNDRAERLYRRLGFEEAHYPEALPVSEPVRYMVAGGEPARALRVGYVSSGRCFPN
jgi:ribosomal protein S18 acetylase RimI-like enzyme